ncbi:MAG: ComEC family competence protein [Microgenomates group bacterium ADurb.Bin219]|nr:MAG: ComEC family competence protein [Microgenomates group bacterium ADurb.Bin219]HNP89165.1 MBL fold metallo-hydrolase [Candidatus Woesebacteria bacterium]
MFQIFLSKFKLKHGLGILALFTGLVWLIVFSFPNRKLNIIFCDVGQGDAILIQKGTDQILVDAGPDKKVLDCLANNMPFWDRTIEAVILSHPEADHYKGLIYIVERYSIRYFFGSPVGNVDSEFQKLAEKIKAKTKVINPYLGDKINFFGSELAFLWPERTWVSGKISSLALESGSQSMDSGSVLGATTTDLLNNFSLVFLLKYGQTKVLFSGDADAGIQDEILLNNNTLNRIDILKVAHHGAKTSLSDRFLEIIRPRQAIISVGKNSFGHPNPDLIKKMEKEGIKVRRTDLEGEIKLQI